MAFKVMLLLFLAMFVLIEHNAMAVQNINPICAALCVVKCNTKPICLTLCLAKCSITKITYEESVDTEPTNHVCNVGCSLGHCFKFLVNYDHDKFGSCMTSCNENCCINDNINIALPKA
ncbi:hypothetical protein EJD97_011492 [Solanum chilense]|uniref:Uncharacterized protein n=2 Tax=Solanum subgen. Lycopersicon TaxID=49274 RepID=A0A3Q7J6G9_SOLLC|nr:hypothetical protein EJD97_011492 [Solanum chilense]